MNTERVRNVDRDKETKQVVRPKQQVGNCDSQLRKRHGQRGILEATQVRILLIKKREINTSQIGLHAQSGMFNITAASFTTSVVCVMER